MELFAILIAICLSQGKLWVINKGYPWSPDVNPYILAINFQPE